MVSLSHMLIEILLDSPTFHKMAKLKTKVNDDNVEEFIYSIENKQRRSDALDVLQFMKDLSHETPKMWGTSIVGYGQYHYVYESGREGDWMRFAFSPRKQSMTFYIMSRFEEYPDLLKKLGKHKLGKACLYINKLDDVDKTVLKEIISKSLDASYTKYPK